MGLRKGPSLHGLRAGFINSPGSHNSIYLFKLRMPPQSNKLRTPGHTPHHKFVDRSTARQLKSTTRTMYQLRIGNAYLLWGGAAYSIMNENASEMCRLGSTHATALTKNMQIARVAFCHESRCRWQCRPASPIYEHIFTKYFYKCITTVLKIYTIVNGEKTQNSKMIFVWTIYFFL